MNTFIDLLKSSALIQGIIATCVIITVCALAIMGKPIPELLATITLAIVGYFIGVKQGVLTSKGK